VETTWVPGNHRGSTEGRSGWPERTGFRHVMTTTQQRRAFWLYRRSGGYSWSEGSMDRLKRELLEYHERSKHRVNFQVPGPGRLDWTTQPDPFRVLRSSTPRIGVPLAADTLATRYNELRCGALPPAHRFDLSNLAILFELSLGLSAWKSYGAQRWAPRCNPLSGNLHPTQGYVLYPALPGLSGGVCHYPSRDHSLENRAAVDDPRWTGAFPDSEWCSGRHKFDPHGARRGNTAYPPGATASTSAAMWSPR
jgi:hypothetical protein